MSIAKKHKAKVQRLRAQKVNASPAAVVPFAEQEQNNESLPAELQTLKLGFEADLYTLKLLNGDQQRDPIKAVFIEKYRPLCEWFMKNYQNWGHLQCLAWWFVWHIDVKPFDDIEPMLYQGIKQGLTAPLTFKSDWQTFYVDLVRDQSQQNLDAGKEWNDGCVAKVISDIANGDIITKPALKAKMYAVYGKVRMHKDDLKAAIKSFKIALALNEDVGVKKLLKKCEESVAEATQEDEKEVNEPTKESVDND